LLAAEQGRLDGSHQALAGCLGIDFRRVGDVALKQQRQVGLDSLEHASGQGLGWIGETERPQRVSKDASVGAAAAARLDHEHAGQPKIEQLHPDAREFWMHRMLAGSKSTPSLPSRNPVISIAADKSGTNRLRVNV